MNEGLKLFLILLGTAVGLVLLKLVFDLIFYPKSEMYINKGKKAVQKKDINKAIENYLKAYEKKKFKGHNMAWVCTNLALCYLEIKDYENAIKFAEENVSYQNQNPNVYAILARAYFENENIEFAIETLNKKLEIAKNDVNAYSLLGLCYAKLNDEKNAQICIDKAEKYKYPEMKVMRDAIKKELRKHDNK